MDLEDAASRYDRSIEHAMNLLEAHRRLGQGKPGRRRAEHSLNRAVVVTVVATWQAVVQDFARVILDATAPEDDDPHRHVHLMLAAEVRSRIGKLGTPSAEKSRELLQAAGFDPRPRWTWELRQGRAESLTWSPQDVSTHLNKWIRVRHAIAHGDPELPKLDVLLVVRRPERANRDGVPVLRLVDAQECVDFFRHLVEVTGQGVADHLGVTHTRWGVVGHGS